MTFTCVSKVPCHFPGLWQLGSSTAFRYEPWCSSGGLCSATPGTPLVAAISGDLAAGVRCAATCPGALIILQVEGLELRVGMCGKVWDAWSRLSPARSCQAQQ